MQYCLLVRGIWHHLFLFHRLKTLNNKYINKQTNEKNKQEGFLCEEFLERFLPTRAVARKKLQPRRTHGPLYEISRMKSSNIISLIKKIKIDSIWKNFTKASASVRLILATAVPTCVAHNSWREMERASIPMFSLASFPQHLFYIPYTLINKSLSRKFDLAISLSKTCKAGCR